MLITTGLLAALAGSGSSASAAAIAAAAATIATRTNMRARGFREALAMRRSIVELAILLLCQMPENHLRVLIIPGSRRRPAISQAHCANRRASQYLKCKAYFARGKRPRPGV